MHSRLFLETTTNLPRPINTRHTQHTWHSHTQISINTKLKHTRQQLAQPHLQRNPAPSPNNTLHSQARSLEFSAWFVRIRLIRCRGCRCLEERENHMVAKPAVKEGPHEMVEHKWVIPQEPDYRYPTPPLLHSTNL